MNRNAECDDADTLESAPPTADGCAHINRTVFLMSGMTPWERAAVRAYAERVATLHGGAYEARYP